MGRAGAVEEHVEHDWEGRYQAGATPWDLGGPHPMFERWGIEWAPGRRVFIPGCGRGHDALAMARLGHAVVAVDMAPTAIEGLRARADVEGLVVDARVGDAFAEGEREAGRVGVLLEQTFLCAIDPARRPAYVAWAEALLAPGGRLVANWFPLGRPHAMGGPPWGYELDELRGLFASWTWVRETAVSGVDGARTMGEWFAELAPPGSAQPSSAA